MNDKFDELAKGMAQSVTRRGALKKFGTGIAGIALASLGIASNASVDPTRKSRFHHCNCHKAHYGCDPADSACLAYCIGACAP